MRWLLCASIIAVLSGCQAHYLDIDGQIAQRAAQPIDALPPAQQAPEWVPLPKAVEQDKKLPGPADSELPMVQHSELLANDLDLVLATVQNEEMQPAKQKNLLDRLQFPDTIIGRIPDIQLPATAPPKEIAAAIRKQFPELPRLPRLPEPKPGPEGRPLALADLQQMALHMSPQIRQAHLDVEAARGIALQVGLYPNPAIGYEAASIGQGNPDAQRTPGQQGGFVEQTIVTMGKLALARMAATRDIEIVEQRSKATEADVQAQVRAGYFAVLSARETYRVTKAMTELTDELYNVLLLQLSVGEVAPYEPMQIRVLAMQSRGTLVQAHNRYVAAWKQLAATLGTPGMPLTDIEGKIDMPVPHFEHDKVLAFVLAHHTDMIAAQFGVERHRALVRLSEVQPYPDVNVHVSFQKDFTTPPFGTIANVSVGVPFPLWNRNQGNIQAARANLRRAMEDGARVQNDLTIRTADAFERYENNRVLLNLYKEQILPSQVKAFRAALARHNVEGKISYYDVVTSQQTLAGLISSYLGALGDQWTAVVDIAHLTQTQDLFQMQQADEVAPIPDVPELLRGELLHRRR